MINLQLKIVGVFMLALFAVFSDGFKVINAQTIQPYISYISPTSAGIGQQVTVYGSNLYGNIVVWDGTQLSTSMTSYGSADTSGNSLTFTVPTNAVVGQHTIKIEQRVVGGFSNSATLTVVPTISYIIPSTAKVGDLVTIHGTNLYGNSIIIDGQNSGIAPTFPDTTGASMQFVVPSSWSVGVHAIQIEQRIIGGTSNAIPFTVVASKSMATLASVFASPTLITSGQMTTVSYSGTNLAKVTMTVTCPSGVSSPDGHGGDACGRTSIFVSGVMSTKLQLNNTTANNQQIIITISGYDALNSLVGTKSVYATVVASSSPSDTFAPVACSMVAPYCPYGSQTIVRSDGCSQITCNSAPISPAPVANSLPQTITGNNNVSSVQALQQQLVQLMTLLIQLLQQASAKGLLNAGQVNSVLNSIGR